MLNTTVQPRQQGSAVIARRFTFGVPSGKAEGEVFHIAEPRRVTAAAVACNPESLLSGQDLPKPGSLDIVWIPPDFNEAAAMERTAEEWVCEGLHTSRRRPVRAGVRSVRVVWHDTRALVFARAENLNEVLDAILRFTVVEREMASIESEFRSLWEKIAADSPLTSSAVAPNRECQKYVGGMSQRASDLRARLLRVTTALKQVDPSISETSVRLYSELALAADLFERADLADEPTQFALSFYELADTRLFDAKSLSNEVRHAVTGHVLETMIVLILLTELLVFVFDYHMIK